MRIAASFVFAKDPTAFLGAIPYDMTGVEFTHHGGPYFYLWTWPGFGNDVETGEGSGNE